MTFFEEHICDIYPPELSLSKANTSNSQAPFLDLNLHIKNNHIYSNIYDKRDDFGFPIVNYPWLDGDVPRVPSYGIYTSQLVRYARGCTYVSDFHRRNKTITSKLLNQGYRYHKLRKTFGKFFASYSELLSKYGQISFAEFVSMGISHPSFYGDLVYKLRRIKNDNTRFSVCKGIVRRLLKRGYDLTILKRTVLMVWGPFTAYDLNTLFNYTLTNQVVET